MSTETQTIFIFVTLILVDFSLFLCTPYLGPFTACLANGTFFGSAGSLHRLEEVLLPRLEMISCCMS